MDYEIDQDMMNPVGDGEYEAQPFLHCNFTQIGTSLKYDYSTTYYCKYQPEYVNLTLYDEHGNMYNYTMSKRYSDDNDYAEGVIYNVTVDFETEFNETQRAGQWFYSFKGKSDPTEGEGKTFEWPLNSLSFYMQPAQCIGEEIVYLLYSNTTSLTFDSTDSVNFYVTGCQFHTAKDPTEVSLNLIFPDKSIVPIEMTTISSYTFENVHPNSSLYEKVFTDYKASVNLSEYYNFDSSTQIDYYFDAVMNDSSRSFLMSSYEDSSNKNSMISIPFAANVKSNDDVGVPEIIKYRVEDLTWSRSWNHEKDNAKIIFKQLIQPICDEHILRFWVWVDDPSGTYEEHYYQSNFVFEPKLELINLDDPEDPIEIGMKYCQYDDQLDADMYFVDLVNDGDCYYYGNKWPDDKTSDHKIEDFGAGAWDFSFSVCDNDTNTDEMEGYHRIWQTGSLESFKTVLFGGVPSSKKNPLLSTFAEWMIEAKLVLFMAAAMLSVLQKQNVARVLTIGTGIFDLLYRLTAGLSFDNDSDAGAILGLALHSLLTAGMCLVAKQLNNFLNNIKAKAFKLTKLGHIAKLMPIILLLTYFYCDPLKLWEPDTMLACFGIHIPSFIKMLLGYERKSPDLNMPDEEFIKVPLSFLMLIFSSLGLGLLLNLAGRNKESITGGGSYGGISFLTTKKEPVSSVLNMYTAITLIISLSFLGVYMDRTGYKHVVINHMFEVMCPSLIGGDIDPFSDPPMEFD